MVHKKIFWLDVPVNDAIAVQVGKSIGNLDEILAGVGLRKSAATLRSQQLVQLSFCAVLQEEINIVAIVKVSI